MSYDFLQDDAKIFAHPPNEKQLIVSLSYDTLFSLCFTHEVAMNDYRDIITIEPGKRSGQPCIRGMRITVYDVFEYLASGMTVAEVLDDFPELTETDIRACFAYASEPIKPTGGATGGSVS